MIKPIYLALFLIVLGLASAANTPAGLCAKTCDKMKLDVLTIAMCRDAKKQLPKPKVGDYCTVAMEQGYSDACVALCMNQAPQNRVAQACRAASMEMPRPTIRRWCEHGYSVAYDKTLKDLKTHFAGDSVISGNQEGVPASAKAKVMNSMQISLDNTMRTLDIHEGENAEDALATFCTRFAEDDAAGCIRNLLPVVLERLSEA